ncbi:YfcE family phosphodiesterase [Aliarcobacter faecis]|uniref:metallophosphoesterase family protein n=1 Tax=Aliarcobacter faecis TaxID=1564138 RepID=UPI00047E016E|nr:YfcE family phosphodiesterase [Aliarcobacter faecis]QKF72314.1 YfcE family phosphodiesterase [Aliarcobacter faecis]
MKIAIVSDSHHKTLYLKECIDFLKEEGCEYLIHAGDICSQEGLEILKNSSLKYIAVFGNNDRNLFEFSDKYNIKAEPYYFKIDNISFKLMHLPLHLSPDTDIIIFGHTHKFHCEYKNKKLYINSGEVCAREKPFIECAKLEINANEYIITHYFKKNNENNFMKEEFKYEQ